MRRMPVVLQGDKKAAMSQALPKLPGNVPQVWFVIENNNNMEFILRSITHIPIKTVSKWSNSSDPCELPLCSELNNPHHKSGHRHSSPSFFPPRSIRVNVILNICAFLSLFAVVTHAADSANVVENKGIPSYGTGWPVKTIQDK